MANSDDDVLTIQLEDSRDVQMHFEVEKSGSLDAVFSQYTQFKGLTPESLQFTYKGTVIKPDDTPNSLGMSVDDNTVNVSLVGIALTKDQIVQSCTAGEISTAIELLSENSELCKERLNWFDSDGQELNTPPIFIAIDYGHLDLVTKLLPLYKDMINTIKDGDGDYTALSWASWTVGQECVILSLQ